MRNLNNNQYITNSNYHQYVNNNMRSQGGGGRSPMFTATSINQYREPESSVESIHHQQNAINSYLPNIRQQAARIVNNSPPSPLNQISHIQNPNMYNEQQMKLTNINSIKYYSSQKNIHDNNATGITGAANNILNISEPTGAYKLHENIGVGGGSPFAQQNFGKQKIGVTKQVLENLIKANKTQIMMASQSGNHFSDENSLIKFQQHSPSKQNEKREFGNSNGIHQPGAFSLQYYQNKQLVLGNNHSQSRNSSNFFQDQSILEQNSHPDNSSPHMQQSFHQTTPLQVIKQLSGGNGAEAGSSVLQMPRFSMQDQNIPTRMVNEASYGLTPKKSQGNIGNNNGGHPQGLYNPYVEHLKFQSNLKQQSKNPHFSPPSQKLILKSSNYQSAFNLNPSALSSAGLGGKLSGMPLINQTKIYEGGDGGTDVAKSTYSRNNHFFSKQGSGINTNTRLSNLSFEHEYQPERTLPMDPKQIKARIFQPSAGDQVSPNNFPRNQQNLEQIHRMSKESLKSLVSAATFDHDTQSRLPHQISTGTNKDQYHHLTFKPQEFKFMTPQNYSVHSDNSQPIELIEKIATLFAERDKKFDFNFMKENQLTSQDMSIDNSMQQHYEWQGDYFTPGEYNERYTEGASTDIIPILLQSVSLQGNQTFSNAFNSISKQPQLLNSRPQQQKDENIRNNQINIKDEEDSDIEPPLIHLQMGQDIHDYYQDSSAYSLSIPYSEDVSHINHGTHRGTSSMNIQEEFLDEFIPKEEDEVVTTVTHATATYQTQTIQNKTQKVKPFIPRIKLEKLHQPPPYQTEVIDEREELQYSGYTTTISKNMRSSTGKHSFASKVGESAQIAVPPAPLTFQQQHIKKQSEKNLTNEKEEVPNKVPEKKESKPVVLIKQSQIKFQIDQRQEQKQIPKKSEKNLTQELVNLQIPLPKPNPTRAISNMIQVVHKYKKADIQKESEISPPRRIQTTRKKKLSSHVDSSLADSSLEDEDEEEEEEEEEENEFITIKEDETQLPEENVEYVVKPPKNANIMIPDQKFIAIPNSQKPAGYHSLIKSCFKNGVKTPQSSDNDSANKLTVLKSNNEGISKFVQFTKDQIFHIPKANTIDHVPKMSELKLLFKKEESKSPRASGQNAAAPNQSKDQKKVLFSLKDWSQVGPIKVGTTSLVPVQEYLPIPEESSNGEKTQRGGDKTPPPPKTENMFHFQQAVSYKMKHKDKMTRKILRDQRAKLKLMEMHPEQDFEQINQVAQKLPKPPKQKRRFVDFIIKYHATDGSPSDFKNFLP